MRRTVSVGEFPSRDEARLAEGMLRAHGIDALTRIEDAGGAYPQLAARVQGGTDVHVPVEQADEARRLLAQVTPATDAGVGPTAGERPVGRRWGGWRLVGLVVGLALLAYLVTELVVLR